jgi:hypothetical protein
VTDLSPAAQAIDTALADCIQLSGEIIRARPLAAAALRAAADQLAYAHGSWAGTSAIIDEDKLLAIAAELEQ